MGKYLRGVIEKLGLHTLDKMWDNGFRQITTSTHPINTPDDLKGFKIRVPVSPQWTSLFKAFGAAPTSINFSEVYSALQTKIVDGQENALQLIDIAKLYEVQKYVSITNHMWDGFFFLINGRAWAKLPPALQEVVASNVNAAALKQRDDLVKLNQTAEDKLKKHGMVFNRTDPAKFRAVLSNAGYYKEWKAAYGPEAWALLEKYSGPLA
jgi:TRAP-type transport system periplasmic protein